MTPAGDSASPWPGNAQELETELARRVLRLACGLGVAATLLYVLIFAWRGAWWMCLGQALVMLYLAGVALYARRTGRAVRGLSLVAWPLFAVTAVAAFWQNGTAGASVWWMFTLPLLLLQGGATRSAIALALASIGVMATLGVLGAHGLLPRAAALPMGETQRAVSMIGALLFALLMTLMSLRWRRELLDRLGRVHAAAHEAMQVKSRFLANMSHEIRTPLNGIVGAAELLRGSQLDAGQQHLLAVLDRSTEALMALVNDVLDYSKLEAGRMKTEQTVFDLHAAVHDAAKVFAAQAQAKGVELSAHCAATLPRHTVGDAARLRQILHNLLANAVKFTSAGEVHLAAAPDLGPGGAPWLRLSVRDTGIGMDDAQRQTLFEAFAQGDVSTTRRFGGSGLGLAISRELAALLGGHIEVASLPDRGSTFTLMLPHQAPADPPGPTERPALGGHRVWLVSATRSLRDDLGELIASTGASCHAFETLPSTNELAAARADGVGLVLCDDRSLAPAGIDAAAWAACLAAAGLPGVLLAGLAVRATGLPPPLSPLYKPVTPSRLFAALESGLRAPGGRAAPAVAPLPADDGTWPAGVRRVLLAEDNLVNQLVAQGMLERLGLVVTIADNGRVALEAYARTARDLRFDLVLMDCHMPEVDGFACTRRLRALEAEQGLPRTPVVALTASSEAENVAACREAGMDDFLPKPVAFDALSATLGRWLPRP